MRVLIVDDDLIMRSFLGDWLGQQGYRCTICDTLAQAAIELDTGHYALLLLDERLPDGSGGAFLHRWRKDRHRPQPAALLLSGADPLQAQLPEISAFLRKPVDPERLLQVIEALLGGDAEGISPLPPEALPQADAALPDFDDAQALRALGGRMEAVQRLRAMLRTEIERDRPGYARMTDADAGELSALRSSLHRLHAAATMTGCPRLARAAGTLEARLRDGARPGQAEVLDLLAAVDGVLGC